MKYTDKQLGMDRDISRRDFINGTAALAAAAALPGHALAMDSGTASVYPPARGGLRGSHRGSFEVAHQLVWEGRQDWGTVRDAEDDVYDLIVVGAGVSGLSAAYFYREKHPDARILILDNHDDFGGHAKRNEFQLNGREIIGYGGSQALEGPGYYSEVARNLLTDIGIDTSKFNQYYDHDFYHRNKLSVQTYFDSATFGRDRLVNYPLVSYAQFVPFLAPTISARDAVAQMPIGDNARKELLELIEARGNRITGVAAEDQEHYLRSISYRDFLERHMGVTDPEVFAIFQGLTADSTASIEASTALTILTYSGLPGLKATALADYNDEDEPYIYHFPDGNASVARLLVRDLIPGVAAGSTMDDVVLAKFNYDNLDTSGSSIRLRLNSTVVRVEHDDPSDKASAVSAIYVTGNKAFRVKGRACVMAGYNAMIPHICPELPAAQAEALAQGIKAPILYTSVLLNNWRAWEKLGIGFISSPGGYYGVSFLDFPVSMGGYSFSRNPDEPIIVHMERFAKGNDPDATKRDQRLAGRRELYATPFENIERETRGLLAGALAGGGFDPANDIAAITVNRWGHGYAYWQSPLFDYVDGKPLDLHVTGRQKFGRISIANSDAGASATIDTAIDQAHRAVNEIQG